MSALEPITTLQPRPRSWFDRFKNEIPLFHLRQTRRQVWFSSFFLLAIYLTLLFPVHQSQHHEIVPIELTCIYALPLVGLLLLGRYAGLLCMLANLIPFALRLSSHPAGPALPFLPVDAPIFFESMLFIFFNVSLPLAIMMMLDAYRHSSREDWLSRQKLQDSVALYEDMFENNGSATLICKENGRIVRGNHLAEQLTGRSRKALRRMKLNDLLQSFTADTPQLTPGESQGWELHQANGELRTVRLNVTAMRQSSHLLVTLVDTTGLYRMREELNASREHADYLVSHDALTDLPNRAHMLAILQSKVEFAALAGTRVHVLSIKINEVRLVNERLGIQQGDELLRRLGLMFKNGLGGNHLVGRTRGGVFCFIQEDLQSPAYASNGLNACLEAMPTSLRLGNEELALTYFAGVASYPEDAQSAQELLRCSEYALNTARREQVRDIVHYDENLARATRRRIGLEIALRQGLREDMLTLHYQPKVDAAGRLLSFEALARWHDPLLGHIVPDEFILLAEASDLIHDITRFAVRRTCEQLQIWRQAGHQVLPVSVNLSARDLGSSPLIAELIADIHHHQIPAELIEFEITETALMAHHEVGLANLEMLKKNGFRISIDDFGSGYSSLSKIAHLPVYAIKIDRTFVMGVPGDERKEKIVHTILSLGHSLGLTVIAEGVEEKAQLDFLKERGCQVFQGLFFSAAMPAEMLFPAKAAETSLIT